MAKQELITKERYDLLKQSLKNGADLAPVDFEAMKIYEQTNQGWLLSEEVIERINKKHRDIISMVMDFENGRITSGGLMDKISDRCNAFSQAQLDHCEPLIRVDEAKKYEARIKDQQESLNRIMQDNLELTTVILKLKRQLLNKYDDIHFDERTKTLKEVGKQLEKLVQSYSSWGLSGEPRIKLIQLYDSLKQGVMPKE